ncbi:ornithine cyclodeaminase family protein [Sinanaerobacter sp. ZZT-01]|uniref:ornithine cyclodeaminase family protein n=1 Tax=Sinanaerobacter sp. ZZT-01 TaxID=3111540 RepID=UPI002D769CD4|nr:ornithine cyclodeaminase family protein [Sinanaerobacter sp. ZZT-01]WRR92929.1 ornithine cyclodeaminase family protein [Sinanaerobacter sp. ZZT-01]
MMNTLLLNLNEVQSLLTIEDTVEAVKAGYMAFNRGVVQMPPVVSLMAHKFNGEMDFKMGYSEQEDIIGIKMAGGYWDNPKKYNLPSGLAMICLFDAANGVPICILDGTLITGYRTAAAGTIGALCLARKDAENIAMIGTGMQARLQVMALSKYFNIKNVRVYGIEGQEKYVEEMQSQHPDIHFSATSAQEAVENAEIVITATASHNALVYDQWVKPGTHINAIGCDMEGKQELDPSIFMRAKIVNDSRMECKKRGDTQHPFKAGHITDDNIHAEIGEILLGQKCGRENENEITIFDATGLSVQDINTSLFVYRKAIKNNVGKNIEVFDVNI